MVYEIWLLRSNEFEWMKHLHGGNIKKKKIHGLLDIALGSSKTCGCDAKLQ